ncbi:antitoxin [Kineococcus gynurae]|uniref:Antitoxin n=1 Tax=Kineococcus gynurae TaxID=452979 RepID=A0ABV5LVB6_9ACTN
MGTFDYLKDKLGQAADQAKVVAGQAKDKAGTFAAEHSGQAGSAIDRAAAFVNDKTEGRYADRVAKAGAAARTGVRRVADEAPANPPEAGGTPMDGGTPTDGTPMTGPR